MILTEWPTVFAGADHETMATLLLALFEPIVANLRHALQVVSVPEQAAITSVRFLVIDYGCLRIAVFPFVMRTLAVRPARELLLADALPAFRFVPLRSLDIFLHSFATHLR